MLEEATRLHRLLRQIKCSDATHCDRFKKMLSLYSVWENMTSILLRTNLCPDDVHWSPYSATMPHSLEQRVFPDIFRGSHSRATILVEGSEVTRKVDGANIVFTPVLLMQLLTRMWKSRLVDLAHSAGA